MKTFKTLKKNLAIWLSVALVLFYSLPVGVLAQETTPEPTPTPLPSEALAQEGTPTPTETPTPTPTPEDTSLSSEPPPATESGVIATNSATLTNEVSSAADSGNNQITNSNSTGSSTESSSNQESSGQNQGESSVSSSSPAAASTEPTNAITTGDAVVVTTVENSINTTEINSQVVYQTINLFVDQNGDLDLSDPEALLRLLAAQYPEASVVNVALTQITNNASLDNTISSTANTGNNQINESSGSGQITTGDAYSIIEVLNRINLVVVDSVLHVITLNIFGNLTGNIILPEDTSGGEPCQECGTSTNINNQASVANNVDSQAISGQNSLTASDSASITTGDSLSLVQLTNLVNTNLIGVGLFRLAILPFGFWNGSFLGWGNLAGQAGGQPLTVTALTGGSSDGCPGCVGDVMIASSTNLNNAISSTANTGGNSLSGVSGEINTGRAVSLVSLLNFVNTNLVGSVGFFGFVNIFGSWSGDIGAARFFVEPESEPTPEPTPVVESTSEETPWTREPGGQLEVSIAHNVGEYVLPGDTVTFFINVKNTGSGQVYDVKLDLRLVKNGQDMGGAQYSLGNLIPGRGVKVTTGLVLSKEALAGLYTARATASGLVGPGDTTTSTTGETQFLIAGAAALAQIVPAGTAPPLTEILGSSIGPAGPTRAEREDLMKRLLASLGMVFLTIQGIRRRRDLAISLYNLRLFL